MGLVEELKGFASSWGMRSVRTSKGRALNRLLVNDQWTQNASLSFHSGLNLKQQVARCQVLSKHLQRSNHIFHATRLHVQRGIAALLRPGELEQPCMNSVTVVLSSILLLVMKTDEDKIIHCFICP